MQKKPRYSTGLYTDGCTVYEMVAYRISINQLGILHICQYTLNKRHFRGRRHEDCMEMEINQLYRRIVLDKPRPSPPARSINR